MPSFVSLLNPNKYSFLLSEKGIFKANMKDISVTNVKYYVDLIHEQVRLDLPFEQRIENDLTEINVSFILIQVSFSSLNELVHHSRKHLLNIGILEFNFDSF